MLLANIEGCLCIPLGSFCKDMIIRRLDIAISKVSVNIPPSYCAKFHRRRSRCEHTSEVACWTTPRYLLIANI